MKKKSGHVDSRYSIFPVQSKRDVYQEFCTSFVRKNWCSTTIMTNYLTLYSHNNSERRTVQIRNRELKDDSKIRRRCRIGNSKITLRPLSEPVSVIDATEFNAGASRPPAKRRVINLGHCPGCLNKPVSLPLVVHPLSVPVTVVTTNEGEKSNGNKRKDVHDDGLC